MDVAMDLNAERAVLGCCLLSSEALNYAMETVSTLDFYDLQHREAFQHINKMYKDKIAVEPLTFASSGNKSLNPQVLMVSCIDAVTSTHNYKHYIDLIKDKSYRRYMSNVISDLQSHLNDDNLQQIARDIAEDMFQHSLQDSAVNDELFEEMDDYLKRIYALEAPPKFGMGVSLVDQQFQGGVLPGQNISLVGAQGSMKTSLALHAAREYISKYHRKVVFFSLDMSVPLVEMRLIQQTARVSEAVLMDNFHNNTDVYQGWRTRSKEGLGGLFKIYRYDRGGNILNLSQIENIIRREKPGVVILDYVTAVNGLPNEHTAAQEVSKSLCALSGELNFSTLFLSQIGRENKGQQKKGNIGNHAKGSGVVEEKVDVELELVKPPRNQELEKDGTHFVGIVITKNRKGPTFREYALFLDPASMSFTGRSAELQRSDKFKQESIWTNQVMLKKNPWK